MRIRIILSIVCLIGISVMKLNAQSITVKGTVQSSTGDPLSGVSITVSNKATSTDAAGKFSIDVNKGASVTYSYVGYASQTVAYTQNTTVNISLAQSVITDEDVVLIGYGSKKKNELSTAISSIGSKEITSVPVADAAQAMQGKVAGVVIVQGSGAPGGTGGTGIKIRGISSLTGSNNPLIVLDGYPLPDQRADNILNSFGTNDIESISVLKDGAAKNIYGVRASNGVILITTKRGRVGRTSVDVQVYRGIQEAWQLPSMLNAREYAIANTEARIASGLAPLPKLLDFNGIEQQYGKGTNWLDQIFRRAAITNATFSVSGGSEKAQYLISAGYFKQDGIIVNTDFERFNLRFNGDVKVSNRLKFGNSLTLTKTIEHPADTYTPFNSVILLALTSPPTVRAKNDDGSYAGGQSEDGFSEPNPIYQLEVPQNSNTKYRVNGNVFAEVNVFKGLKFKSVLGADFVYQEIKSFNPATPSTGGRPFLQTGFFTQTGFNPDYFLENSLTYDTKFGSLHKLNVVVAQNFQETRFSFVNASRAGTFNIPVLSNTVFVPADLSQIGNGSGEGISNRLISYLTRVSYDYANKGFFTASIRRDGSTSFAPANRFAYFPTVSGAWDFSKAAFLDNLKSVSQLKLRASYAITGNQQLANNGPNNPAYLQLINQSFQYTFGNSAGSGGTVQGAAVSGSFNPNIKWERTAEFNVGLDATMFKNRVTLALDVFQRKTKNLLLYVAPPLLSGAFESVPFNSGVLENRGIELTLGATVLENSPVEWTSNLVMTAYKNNVTSLGLSAPLDNGFARITGGSLRTQQGLPAQYFFGFVTEGIFQNYGEIAKHAVQTAGTDPTTSTAPGDIKFKDINSDGVINDKDRTNIGNANPNFTYGLTNNFKYKNFELNVFLQGSQGNKVLNFTRWYTEGGVSNGNYSNAVLQRWTGDGSTNSFPRLTLNDPNGNNRVSDRFVEDGSYLRVKNVTFAYNFPQTWVRKAGLSSTQFYVSGQNLITVTNYSGLDPEMGGSVDYGFYPQARTYLAGIRIGL